MFRWQIGRVCDEGKACCRVMVGSSDSSRITCQGVRGGREGEGKC